ncbi:MAG: ATP-binding protein [Chlorobi bacterium]|nr:ATP-binding protein [Chlorobiota bacterium]
MGISANRDRSIVGRAQQIAELCEHIDTVLAGKDELNTFFVSGEAGIGKTTLLAALQEKLLSSPHLPTIITTDCSTPLAGQ